MSSPDTAKETARSTRVRGRTRDQLARDRALARDAAAWSIEQDLATGARAACAEHDKFDEDCGRCAWMMEELDRIVERLRGVSS